MKRVFTDNTNNDWIVSVTVQAVKRCRELVGIDLTDVAGGKLTTKLINDPCALVDCLFAVIKPQADAKGITDREFGEALAGDAIENATKVLLEALVDFFPNARDRRAMEKVNAATLQTIEAARDVRDASLETAIEKATGEALAQFSSGLTSSPESPASTPDPTPCES